MLFLPLTLSAIPCARDLASSERTQHIISFDTRRPIRELKAVVAATLDLNPEHFLLKPQHDAAAEVRPLIIVSGLEAWEVLKGAGLPFSFH